MRLRFGPRNVGFQEIGETQKVKERENEFPDETQKGECVEEKLWEENLCVSHRKPHGNLERESEEL